MFPKPVQNLFRTKIKRSNSVVAKTLDDHNDKSSFGKSGCGLYNSKNVLKISV